MIVKHLPKHFGLPVLAGLAFWAVACPLSGRAAVVNVSVGDNFFNPTSSPIKVNDQVKWTWNGSHSHSSTGNTGLWDSGIHGNGFTYSRTFTTAGNFPYHCTIHGFQTGSVTVQAVNVPPSVAITSPTNGTSFIAPANVTIQAAASDSDGSVTNVQFFDGATSLGHATSSPYSIAADLALGSHTLTARALDNLGATTTSAAVTVTMISNAPPTVSITSPANGTSFIAPANVSIQAAASDSDGSVTNVQFFDGVTSLGNATSSPYSISANLALGSHSLTAVASDNQGATMTSSNVVIKVVTPVPIVLSSPKRVSASVYQFDYSADPGLSYVVLRSGDLLGFTAISTNTATTNTVNFLDNSATGAVNFYRVHLLPNP